MYLATQAREAANAARSHELGPVLQFLESARRTRQQRSAQLSKTEPLQKSLSELSDAFEDFLESFGLELPAALDPADLDQALATIESFVPTQLDALECLDELIDLEELSARIAEGGLWDDELEEDFSLLADSLDDLAGVLDAIDDPTSLELIEADDLDVVWSVA